jgi:hypothetical protein
LDATSLLSINEMSKFTIMIYLSDNNDGATYFNKYDLNILPIKGRCVIFDLNLLHSGKINSTTKYFIRSDLYYERNEKILPDDLDYIMFDTYNKAISLNNAELENLALSNSEILSEMVYNY